VSLGRLMYPAGVLAILTGLCSVYMAMYWIPHYTREVEIILRDDIKRVAMARLRSRGMAEIRGFQGSRGRLFADYADPNTEPPVMDGVLAIIERIDRPTEVVTAQSVRLDFDRGRDRLILFLDDSWGSPQGRQIEASTMIVQIPLPPRISDKVKYKDVEALFALREEPIGDPGVQMGLQLVQNLYHRQRFMELLAERFATGPGPWTHTFRREDPLPAGKSAATTTPLTDTVGRRYRLTVPQREKAEGILQMQNPTLEIFRHGFENRPTEAPDYERYQARFAVIEPRLKFTGGTNDLRLEMRNCTSALQRQGDELREIPSIRQGSFSVDGLLMEPILETSETPDYAEVYRNLDRYTAHPDMADARGNVTQAINKLLRNIEAELHSRLAMGVCCLLFVFLGAGLGVLCRTGDYVLALCISSAPGAVTLGVIVMGRRVLVDLESPTIGIAVIWGGPVLLLIVAIFLFRHLMKR